MNEIYVYHYKFNDTHCCKLMLYDIQLKMKYRANIYKKNGEPQAGHPYFRATVLDFATFYTNKINYRSL